MQLLGCLSIPNGCEIVIPEPDSHAATTKSRGILDTHPHQGLEWELQAVKSVVSTDKTARARMTSFYPTTYTPTTLNNSQGEGIQSYEPWSQYYSV